MRIFILFSIIFCQFACNKCQNYECKNNNISIHYRDRSGLDLLMQTSTLPSVIFKSDGIESIPSIPPFIKGSALFISQEFREGIAIINFQKKKDTLFLINPNFDRESECCKLPFADSVLINGKIRMTADFAIITR